MFCGGDKLCVVAGRAVVGGSVNRPATTRHVISVYSRSLAGL